MADVKASESAAKGTEAPVEAPEVVEAEPVQAASPAPVVPEAPVEAAPIADLPDPSKHYVAMRDFLARFEHLIHRFTEGQVIDPRIGHALRKTGSPIKLVDKTAEEIKAAL